MEQQKTPTSVLGVGRGLYDYKISNCQLKQSKTPEEGRVTISQQPQYHKKDDEKITITSTTTKITAPTTMTQNRS